MNFPIPRIDVDTASRERLVAHIDTLEDILVSVLPVTDETFSMRRLLGITQTESLILTCLLTGERQSRHRLRAASRCGGDKYETKSVDVHVLHLRRKLARHGLQIKNDWGHGFYIEADGIQRLRLLLSERKAA